MHTDSPVLCEREKNEHALTAYCWFPFGGSEVVNVPLDADVVLEVVHRLRPRAAVEARGREHAQHEAGVLSTVNVARVVWKQNTKPQARSFMIAIECAVNH